MNKSFKTKENEKSILHSKEVNAGGTIYPASEDIYNQSKEESNKDPENISETKVKNDSNNKSKNRNHAEGMSGEDLDIPGAELDDDMEEIGSEDEENNFYSLGGDNNNNLEEDNQQ